MTYRYLLITLFIAISSNSALAQQKCPEHDDWNNHCYGKYTNENGDIMEGQWHDNLLDGYGTYIFGPKSDWASDKYVGDFKKGILMGMVPTIMDQIERKKNSQEISTLVNGKMISLTDKAPTFLMTEQNTLVNLKMVYRMDKALKFGIMEISTLVNGKMIKDTDKAPTFLKMERNTLVNGKIVKQMGMENIHGQMAMFIKVILKTIIVMVKEQKFTQMVMLEKVNGLTMFIRPIVNL